MSSLSSIPALPAILSSSSDFLQNMDSGEITIDTLYEHCKLPAVSREHLGHLLGILTEFLQSECVVPTTIFHENTFFCPKEETKYHLSLLRITRIADYLLMPEAVLDTLAYLCLTTFLCSEEWSADLFVPNIEWRIRRIWSQSMDEFNIWHHYYTGPVELEEHQWHTEFIAHRVAPNPMEALKDPFGADVRQLVAECGMNDFVSTMCIYAFPKPAWMDRNFRTQIPPYSGPTDNWWKGDNPYKWYIEEHVEKCTEDLQDYVAFEKLRQSFAAEGHYIHPLPVCDCATCFDIKAAIEHRQKYAECTCSYCSCVSLTKEQLGYIEDVLGAWVLRGISKKLYRMGMCCENCPNCYCS